jgi:hypothetical protein
MSDIIWLYCIVCYLFNIGLVFSSWDECDQDEKIGSVICLILSPLALPVIFGVSYWRRNG